MLKEEFESVGLDILKLTLEEMDYYTRKYSRVDILKAIPFLPIQLDEKKALNWLTNYPSIAMKFYSPFMENDQALLDSLVSYGWILASKAPKYIDRFMVNKYYYGHYDVYYFSPTILELKESLSEEFITLAKKIKDLNKRNYFDVRSYRF